MSRGTLPSSDYLLDTKTVMDNAARVMQAMIDITAELGYLANCIRVVRILQGTDLSIFLKFHIFIKAFHKVVGLQTIPLQLFQMWTRRKLITSGQK
jgi:hypothetical protein